MTKQFDIYFTVFLIHQWLEISLWFNMELVPLTSQTRHCPPWKVGEVGAGRRQESLFPSCRPAPQWPALMMKCQPLCWEITSSTNSAPCPRQNRTVTWKVGLGKCWRSQLSGWQTHPAGNTVKSVLNDPKQGSNAALYTPKHPSLAALTGSHHGPFM